MTDRRGFTLAEVLVALAIASIVLLDARMLLANVTDFEERIGAQQRQYEQAMGAERQIRLALANIDVTGRNGQFAGDSTGVAFTSWVPVAGGWLERSHLSLFFQQGASADSLVVSFPGSAPYVLLAGFQHGAIRYLESAAAGGTWVSRWDASEKPPAAVLILRDHDTTLFALGAYQ